MPTLGSLLACVLVGAVPQGGITIGLEDPENGRMVYRHGVFEMTGGAFVKVDAESIRADTVRYTDSTNDVEAEGEVTFISPPYTFFAASIRYNMNERFGTLNKVEVFREFERAAGGKGRIEQGEIDVVVLRAESVQKLGDEYKAAGVSVTTCGMDPPHYALTAAEAFFSAETRTISLRQCRLKWGGKTLLRFSLLESTIDDLDKIIFPRFRLGRRGDWGWWGSVGIRRPFDDGFEEASFVYRGDRGPGLGYVRKEGPLSLNFGLVYEGVVSAADDLDRALDNLARRGSLLDGTPPYLLLEDYLYTERRLLDTIGTPDNSPVFYADNLRWGLRVSWRDENGPWRSAFSMDITSDRDYLYEYDRRRYYSEWDRATYFEAECFSRWSMVDVVMRLRLEDFREETEYLPELRLKTLPLLLPGGLDLGVDMRAGIVRHEFDEVQAREGLSAFRSHNAVRLGRRIEPAAGLLLNPFFEGRFTWYSDSRLGEAVTQAGLTYGVDMSLLVTGEFDDGLRHVVRPLVSFVNTPVATADPLDVFDFDEVEDFAAGRRLKFALFQDWWRRREDGTAPLGRFNLETSLLLDDESRLNLNSGNRWTPLKMDAALSGAAGLSGKVDAVIGLHGEGLMDIYARLGYDRRLPFGTDGLDSVYLAYSGLKADPARSILPDQRLEGGCGYAAGRYHVEWGMGYEFENNVMVTRGQIYNVGRVVRDFHDLRLGIGVRYGWEDRDIRVSLSLEPSGYPPAPVILPAPSD